MVQNSQKYRLQYRATRSSICSFARSAHSFACSGLLASLAPSTALTRLLARSLPRSWESELLDGYSVCFFFFFIFDHSEMTFTGDSVCQCKSSVAFSSWWHRSCVSRLADLNLRCMTRGLWSQECTVGQNREKHRIHSHLIIHYLKSKGVSEMSERANEEAQRSVRAK